ncbi:MAG TPA: FtsX-like permease family protein [Polyangia bacterium]|nr:FtsX-like permease family protein [Polyangia bacterium]
MNLPLLAFRNARRNKTRTLLTVLGVTIAVFAFGFLRTVINAYYLGAEAAAKDRLVVRNLVSLVVPLPISYHQKLERVPGVTKVATANWFGGVYLDPKNFFAQFAIESEPYLDMYPEYLISPEEKQAYLADRSGCLVGEKLAKKFGWKVGQTITLQGTIFSGNWKFTLRGIYKGRDHATDTTQFFFHWKYMDESLTKDRQGQAGLFLVAISDPDRSAEIAKAIDTTFKGSTAETLTESERAFQLSFISMVSAVISALQVVSVFVLVIVALILGNTIAMSVRERGAEVAILKALGFTGGRLAALITGESALIGALGGLCGVALAVPIIHGFGQFIEANLGSFFPVFDLDRPTTLAMLGLSVAVGLLAALLPAARVAQLAVVDAMRRVG